MDRDGTFTVEHPTVIASLHGEATLDCLGVLMGGEETTGGLARRLGLPVGSVHYRVQLLLAHGLVEVRREERRAGRIVKVYGACTARYFVPFARTDEADLEAFWWSVTRPLFADFVRDLARNVGRRAPAPSTWGLLIERDEPDGVRLRFTAAPVSEASARPGGPVSTLTWEALSLTHEQARDLARDIRAVVERYKTETGPHAYVWQGGLAPQEADEHHGPRPPDG